MSTPKQAELISSGHDVWRRGSNSAATPRTGEEDRRTCGGGSAGDGEHPCSREDAPLLPGSGADGPRGLRESQAAGEDGDAHAARGRRGRGARQGVRAELRRAPGQTGAVRAAARPAGHHGDGGLRGHRSRRGRREGPAGEWRPPECTRIPLRP